MRRVQELVDDDALTFPVVPEKQMPCLLCDVQARPRNQRYELMCIREWYERIIVTADNERFMANAMQE